MPRTINKETLSLFLSIRKLECDLGFREETASEAYAYAAQMTIALEETCSTALSQAIKKIKEWSEDYDAKEDSETVALLDAILNLLNRANTKDRASEAKLTQAPNN